ncbi:MAG: bifunctional riboflavin kinase/FAD synthetase [Ktedonobacterales bacterium]
MRVYYDFGSLPPMGPAALTLGVFDGVHAGHRRLVARAAELAVAQGIHAVAVTFWPHPASTLRPADAPPLLTSLETRLALLAELGGLDAVVVQPFTPELAALEPEAYLDHLQRWCEPRVFVEGPDFALGRDRTGSLPYLREAGARRGFTVESVAVVEDGERISSSRVRNLLLEGRVEDVARLLARRYTLVGEVVEGDRRGRLLGFPTANLRVAANAALPANGVYAVRVRLPGESGAHHPAVANLGVRPTFGGEPRRLLEVHMLGVAMDLYGLELGVEWVARLREEKRFDGVDALKTQIALDAQRAADLLGLGVDTAAPAKESMAGAADWSRHSWA